MKKKLFLILFLTVIAVAILIYNLIFVDSVQKGINPKTLYLSELSSETASEITSIIQKIPLTADKMVFESIQKKCFSTDDSSLEKVIHFVDLGNSYREGTYYDGSIRISDSTYKLKNFGDSYSEESNSFIPGGQLLVNGNEIFSDTDKINIISLIEQEVEQSDYSVTVLDNWLITRYYNNDQHSFQGVIKSFQEWENDVDFVNEGISVNLTDTDGVQLSFDVSINRNNDKTVNKFTYDKIEFNPSSVQNKKDLMESLNRFLVQ